MMKKLLICGLALTFGVSVMAQQPSRLNDLKGRNLKDKAQVVNGETKTTANGQPAAIAVRKKTTPPSTQAVSLVTIGQSGNAFGTAFGSKTALFAHPVINSVAMVFRSAPAVTGDVSSGCLRYGYSTDGGTTWTANAGPLYTSNGTNAAPLANARYPQGVIYNPTGNTTPANAFVSHFSPTLAGVGISGWGGHGHGSIALTGGTATAVEDLRDAYLIPDGGALNTNDNSFWLSNGLFDLVSGDYNDTMMLAAGVWSAGDYAYTYNSIYAPVDIDAAGGKNLAATNVAWGNNGTGYMALLAHESFAQVADSNLYPVIFKTSDNGVTWTKVAAFDMNSFDAFFQFGTAYTTGFEFDMNVDANNNLHLAIAVGPLGGNAFSISTGAGDWGLFDIYTTDGGNSWSAQNLALPQTFRGTFTDGTNTLNEDSRPQISRTLDGTKMFFTWFDTDTLTFGVTENTFPDAQTMALNVTTGLWTAATNMTVGTDADGACIFGNVSPFVLDAATSGCYEIPVSILELTGGGVGVQCDHKYIDGLELCDAAFTVAGTPITVANLVAQGINENSGTTSFTLSQNFPNPFNGSTQFNLNLVKSSNVTVEVYSVVGKLVKTVSYTNMAAGLNTLTIDASDLSSGLYTYTVVVGAEKATRTMIVK
ncbi:MAG: T9SS type A sorting domain-containing protein [Bacteroidia bacterium]|nr:T9SS type A sorting domain-containing protein [Bacteroidia bacterium]